MVSVSVGKSEVNNQRIPTPQKSDCTSTTESLPSSVQISLGEVFAKTSMNMERAYQQGELTLILQRREVVPCVVNSKIMERKLQMKTSQFKDYNELPLFLNAETIAKVLGISPASSYELLHEPGSPVLKIGNRMVVSKEKFIQWVEENTAGGKTS